MEVIFIFFLFPHKRCNNSKENHLGGYCHYALLHLTAPLRCCMQEGRRPWKTARETGIGYLRCPTDWAPLVDPPAPNRLCSFQIPWARMSVEQLSTRCHYDGGASHSATSGTTIVQLVSVNQITSMIYAFNFEGIFTQSITWTTAAAETDQRRSIYSVTTAA